MIYLFWTYYINKKNDVIDYTNIVDKKTEQNVSLKKKQKVNNNCMAIRKICKACGRDNGYYVLVVTKNGRSFRQKSTNIRRTI